VTLKALNQEGIALESANREAGLIRTDYMNVSPWERNRCDLRFAQETQQETRINIRCRYEGRWETSEPFKDFTKTSPHKAMKVEEEFYRRIDPYILPFEQSAKAKEKIHEKVEPKAAPPSKIIEEPLQPAIPPPAAIGTPALKAEAMGVVPPAPGEKPPEPKADMEPAKVHMIALGIANVRLVPSTQSQIKTTLKKGDQIEKVGESGTWTKVRLPSGEVGWTHSVFLREAIPRADIRTRKPEKAPVPAAAKPAEGKKAAVEPPSKVILATKEITKMRAEPNAKSKVVLVLKKGRQVEKLGESGEYTKVRLSWGDTGWVLTESLERVP
jgi:SH3-like domain-containing protein